MPPTRRCYRLNGLVVLTGLGLHVDRILAGEWVGAKKQIRSRFCILHFPSRIFHVRSEQRRRGRVSLRERVSMCQEPEALRGNNEGKGPSHFAPARLER